ncbi:MAG: hypothetical protein PHS77_02555 [Gallionellaceae bacterium]|nr:hypothetical protein [Gallionellaceae bacterium]
MTQFTFGYSDSEDRIWLSSSNGARYWLTRRLLVGLLGPVTSLLEKTVPGGDIPHALPPIQRIALEHEEALADSPDGQPALERNKDTRAAGAPPAQPVLVTGLTFQANGRRCTLIVNTSHGQSQIKLNRMDFHRLLAALYRISLTAGWQVAGLPDWLAGDAT